MSSIKEQKALIDASELLSGYCAKTKSCSDCLFGHPDCMFQEHRGDASISPSEWNIPKFRRFSEADKKLAEALTMFGYDIVGRGRNCEFCIAQKQNYDKPATKIPLMQEAFKGMKDGEFLHLNEIIKEGETDEDT